MGLFYLAKTINWQACQWPWDSRYTRLVWLFKPTELQQWKREGEVCGQGMGRRKEEEGITLSGSGIWMAAKIKKEDKRKQNSWRQLSFTHL